MPLITHIRLRAAGNGDELTRRMEDLLKNFDTKKAEELGKWFGETFRVKSPKTPRGQKKLKELGDKLLWWLLHGKMHGEEPHRENIGYAWDDIKSQVPNLVKYFSDEGGKVVPKDMKVGNIHYLNLIGFEKSKFEKYVKQLDALFKSVKGWRKKAFVGTLKVALAGPKHFRGTSGGVYKSGEDTLYVRATPKVLKRGEGTYGSPQYIMIHELGHRFEYKHRPRIDFDRQMWKTTPYSRKEGEAFAELFALGHFGIKKAHTDWDASIQERFEEAMEKGGNTVPYREVPKHIKDLSKPKWQTLSSAGGLIATVRRLARSTGGLQGPFQDKYDEPFYKMDVGKDRFIHFTTPEAAKVIVKSKTLGKGSGSIFAVSLVWGWYVPGVQLTHIDSPHVVAVLFTTTKKPDKGNFVDEVTWHSKVPLKSAKIVSKGDAIRLLKKVPFPLKDEEAYVLYP